MAATVAAVAGAAITGAGSAVGTANAFGALLFLLPNVAKRQSQDQGDHKDNQDIFHGFAS
jgi:hypothetical protein